MMRTGVAALAAAAVVACAGAAQAGEVFGGVYAHAVGTKQAEGGVDTMVGYRTDRIEGWTWLRAPSVHGMISVNSDVDTHFAAVGLNWPIQIGRSNFFIRPGLGLAYTTGEADIGNAFEPGISAAERNRRLTLSRERIDFGSKVLFEPELAVGYRFSERLSAELSYVHLSNGQILHQGKNQGLDDVGVRISYRF